MNLEQWRTQAVLSRTPHAALPFFAGSAFRTPFLRKAPRESMHKKDYYLFITKKAFRRGIDSCAGSICRADIGMSQEAKRKIDVLFESINRDKVVCIAFSSYAEIKNYPINKLAVVCSWLCREYIVVLLGREEEAELSLELESGIGNSKRVLNLAGKTDICEVWYILKNYASLLIGVDCGLIHISSYINVPTIGIYGPTPAEVYGPWSSTGKAVISNLECSPCNESSCRYKRVKCLECIEPESIVAFAEDLLKRGREP